jgi:RNA polymerase sigma-70 factor (ECF subfamily)
MNDELRAQQMDEHMIIILAKEGQPDAFRRIYEEHWERLLRIALRHTGSKLDAEDIMQETFIKAFKRIKTFKFNISTSFAAWLNSICINCAIDHLRKQRRSLRDKQVSLSDLSKELRSKNPSPEDTAIQKLASSRISEAMGILSPKQRIIFNMRFSRHMDIKDIAADLQCSQSNIKTQIFRSLRKLRKTLEPIWEES